MSMPDFVLSPTGLEHSQRLLESFERLLQRPLISRAGTIVEQARRLFETPFVVVSHGTQSDPILNYANRSALTLWEMEPEEFFQTPSRLTAEPMHRDERRRLLERTTQQGYVDDYRGIRVSRSGQRFQIEQAIVWNLTDAGGVYCGQAATFETWIPLAR